MDAPDMRTRVSAAQGRAARGDRFRAPQPRGTRLRAAHTGPVETGDRVQEALRAIPRGAFLRRLERLRARVDAPLPIGHGQTNSQPSTVREMLELLDVQPGDRVLDVGSGSGWTTALLAR